MKKELLILVVEDSEDDTLLEIQLIKKGGYPVYFERVETAPDFTRATKEKQWDIILSDYAMPAFNGLEALELLKISGRDIPFIIISGTIGEELAVNAMKAGAQDYIMKDNLKRLLPAVERELREAKGRAERRLLEEKKRKTEEALRESESRYRRITENLTDYLYSVSVVGNKVVKTQQGPACEVVTGYSPEEFETDPFLWYEMVVSEDRDLVRHRVDQILKGIDIPPIEHRITRKDGSIRWVSDTTILIRDEQGKLIAYDGVIKDITDRKQYEEALRLSEERFSRIFLYSPIATAIVRYSDSKIVDVNDVFLRETGYEPHELIGHTAIELNLYAEVKERERIVQILQEKGIVENFEYRFREKSGNVRYGVMTSAIIILGGEEHILSLTQDITARKRAEEELRKLSQAVEQSPVSIIITDINGNIEYANPKFFQITGYSREEIIGKNPRILKSGLVPEEIYRRLWDSINSGMEWFGEFQNKKKNGELFWERAYISPIVDRAGNISHFLGIKEDITEQKKTDKALLNSERKYRIVADNTYNWEFWSDRDANYVYCSPSCMRVTGYSAEEFLNDRELLFSIVHPDYRELFGKHLADNDKYGHSVENLHYKIIRKNGEERWIEHICQPVFDEEGNYLGRRGSNSDITEKKETDRKIMNAIISAEEEQRKNFSRELHDGLGPLLSTVKLYFQWLIETTEEEKRDFIAETGLASIDNAIQSIREISNNLSPRILLSVGVIPALKNLINHINATKVLQIDLNYDNERRYPAHIEVTIYRILLELINNTLKYAGASRISIDLIHDLTKNRIKVNFSDNGRGFDMQKVKTDPGGMGLPNMHQRIETYEGNISFETREGCGVKVKFELPIKNPEMK